MRAHAPTAHAVLLNADLLAVFNDSAKELGVLVSPAVELLTLEVSLWARNLADGGGACTAIALLNGADTHTRGPVTVSLNALPGRGWDNSTTVSVRDLWSHESLPPATGSVVLSAGIAAHATVALRLCAQAALAVDTDAPAKLAASGGA